MARAKRKSKEAAVRHEPVRAAVHDSTLPPGFYRSLGSLLAGEARLDDFRADLANFLFESPESGPSIKAALLQARAVGRLPAHIHANLKRVIRESLTEDCATESFFGDMADESSPEHFDASKPHVAEPTVDEQPVAAPGPIELADEVDGVSEDGSEPVEDVPVRPVRDAKLVPLRPGMTLGGRYQLDRAVKGGHVGAVFRARDSRREETGDPEPLVAIKVVSPRFGHSAPAARALRNEARLTRSLSHPSIVRVFDLDVCDGREFIVMEWLEGESLAVRLDRLRPLPMPIDEVAPLLRAVASALDYAHEQEVTHGDIKPGNVLLADDGRIKLLDFGLSVPVPERTDDDGPFAVSKAYASCELLKGRAATPADDVYSVACMAYRMLSGKRVYGSYSALEARDRNSRIDPIPELAPHQWQALEKALSLDPTARPLTVGEFVDALFARAPRRGWTRGPLGTLARAATTAVAAAIVIGGAFWFAVDNGMTVGWQEPAEPDRAKDVSAPRPERGAPPDGSPDAVGPGGLIGLDRAGIIVGESDGATRIVVSGSAVSAVNLRVLATTESGTATAGEDFRPLAGMPVGRAPDEGSGILTVDIVPDTVAESTESFIVRLDAVDHNDLVRDSAIVTIEITDDDGTG